MTTKQINTKQILVIGILTITVALAAIAAITAYKVYTISRQETPLQSKKQASTPEVFQAAQDVCQTTFTLEEIPVPVCYEACTIQTDGTSDCPSNLVCQEGTNICVNSNCPEKSNCICASPLPSPSPSPAPSPTPSPSPTYQCFSECDYNFQCPSVNSVDLECLEVNGVNRCVNPSCKTESDCVCEAVVPSPNPSPSPTYQCWSQCSTTTQCPSNMQCLEVNGVNRCVNPSCKTESDCVCAQIVTPSPSPTPYQAYIPPTPQPSQPELPQAGTFSPTLIITIGGLILLGLGLLL